MSPTPLQLPTDPAEWPGFVTARTGAALDRARMVLATLKDGTPRPAEAVLAAWNDAETALRDTGALVELLARVHPEETVRALAEEREQELSRLLTERDLDPELYRVLAAVDPDVLDDAAGRVLAQLLRDFRRSGVDRDEATRARLRAIAERVTKLGQDFERNIAEDVRSVRATPERLAGLPQDFLDAHPADAEGLVTLTTDYPDVMPVRTFAHDAELRRELMLGLLNRAWPVNEAVLAELLALRAEQAGLLGYAGWPDYDAEVKMVGRGGRIAEFIEQLAVLAEPAARADLEHLLARRRVDDPGATGLDSSDNAYYSELVRRDRFQLDAQQVRAYLDFGAVRAGLLAVTGRLFGLTYRPVPDAPSWHQDVAVHDVYRGDERIGRIHLDLHPRTAKFTHAAMFTLVPGIAGTQLPEAALVCNFPRGLMEHDDVVTLFHEFGHLLHHVLAGDQRWARFSGVATEWDFVEAPSQMLEEWAWDADVLATFARNSAGEPIPADLVARMRSAAEFGKALGVRTQLFYAAVSYRLHLDRPADLTAAVRELQARYDLYTPLPGTHMHASFGHLLGYSSAYYTYLWSLVIAKDLFSAFDRSDLFDQQAASRYRDRVLAPGGSRDAADLVADFLGRPYSLAPFQAWLTGTEPTPAG